MFVAVRRQKGPKILEQKSPQKVIEKGPIFIEISITFSIEKDPQNCPNRSKFKCFLLGVNGIWDERFKAATMLTMSELATDRSKAQNRNFSLF